MYPDDRVLIAIMNNKADWERVLDENWYRIPAKNAPDEVPHIDWLGFYFTAKFGDDKWAIHYYTAVEGHELLRRKDIFPSKPNHPRANDWYYKLMLGPIQHKLPPITSHKWRRITFITTTGDRFDNAVEINDLYERESPLGRLYVTLKEEGYSVEQYWQLEESKATYEVDLVLETRQGWLPINLKDQTNRPSNTVQLSTDASIDESLHKIKKALK